MQALGPALQKLMPDAVIMYNAWPGYSTERAMKALALLPYAKARLQSADVIVVELGGNDFGDQSGVREDLLWMIREVSHAPIVWFGPAHATAAEVAARHNQQAESQREQFEAWRVHWYDSRPWTHLDHVADGVHFTATGYAKWAAYMAGMIRSVTRAALVKRVVVPTVAVTFLGLVWWWLRRG